MTALIRVAVPLVLAVLPAACYCSICQLHSFNEKFYTDLNYMIRENGSTLWYVVAFERPNLSYLTLYHLPENIETNRNCYGYHLSTRSGVILMDFLCVGKETLHSYNILTRSDELYITERRGTQEVLDFRTVNVLRLTEELVLLVSCSRVMRTYGVLVLHRGPVPAEDERFVHTIISAKFPDSLYRWMNYTVTSETYGGDQCNCSNKFVISIRTGSSDGIEQDKRKMFVLITFTGAVIVTMIVKFSKRFF